MKFIKHDANKIKRVGFSWRKPRGRKNKTKVGKKGHRPMPSEGFMTNMKTRGMIAERLPVLVHNVNELEKLSDKNIIIISGSVGKRKRDAILTVCESKKLKVLNNGKRTQHTEKTSQ